ncbi:MAG TPA: MgtC/SapB family protein [Candidatus Baltobacteraceae bacterium]|nr:MgtC/SapB family protein [Candidatus Baltobacteraceae bacterium]
MKQSEITLIEFASRLGAAAGLGIAIGFERQWRQRAAGLHTSSLVAIGAALFALLDTVMNAGDTTRIVAGVVTGVGFIAGGVILKSGPNITGLNTAATMWATAAVGALAGFGLWWEAAAGAVVVMLLNLLLQFAADAINVRAKQTQAAETIYTVSVVCDTQSQNTVSDAILKAINAAPISLQSLARERAQVDSVTINADILSPKPDDARLESLSTALLALPGVQKTTVAQRSY